MNGQTHSEKMFALVEEWQNGLYSQQEFCRQKKINFNKFQYWLKKFRGRKEINPVGFIPVNISTPAKSPLNLEILYPNGVVLKVPFSADLNQIKGLINLAG